MKTIARRLINRAWLAACSREHARFSDALRGVEETQRHYLLNLLRRNANTRFGQKHNFSRIASIAEYQRQVPIQPYETITPYIDAIAHGENNVLTADPVRLFQPTSGTTKGTKLIPWTAAVAKEFRRGIDPWLASLYGRQPALLEGTAYWSISPPVTLERNYGKLRVGFDHDSEYLGYLGQKLFSWVSAVPPDVALCRDITEFRTRTLLALLADENLCLISVWSPTFLTTLLEDFNHRQDGLLELLGRQKSSESRRRADLIRSVLREGRGQIRFDQFWPKLKVISCWTHGASAPYAQNLNWFFPGVEIQGKGLVATEAFVSLPFGEGSDPVLAATSHFFEFQNPDTGEISLAHQLAFGKEYQVIVTTGGGLYRYPLGDRIRVTGFIHGAPCFRFISRDGCVSDLFGEKLSAGFVEHVLCQVMEQQNLKADFLLLAPAVDAREKTGYTLFIQAEMIPDTPGLLRMLETGLAKNFHYRHCRELGQLSALRLFQIQGGKHSATTIFYDAMQSRGIKLGDIKVSCLDCQSGWERRFDGKFFKGQGCAG